jgi:hypothetical protein
VGHTLEIFMNHTTRIDGLRRTDAFRKSVPLQQKLAQVNTEEDLIMNKILVTLTTLGCLMMGSLSPVLGQESTPIAEINGVAVQPSDDYSSVVKVVDASVKGQLLDSGISFILIQNRDDGQPDSITIFKAEDAEVVCAMDGVDSYTLKGTDVACD